jgi:16S rRNA (guanine1516-N2)-methyltransferase
MVEASSFHESMVVTVGHHANDDQRARAAHLAERFQVPVVVERTNVQDTAAGAPLLYVVGRHREQVVHVASGQNMHVQQGLLAIKAQQGRDHPFIRAVVGDGPSPQRIVDATLGLAGDAMHLAHVLSAQVVGIEWSVVMHALLEEGLARLARTPDTRAASAIAAHHGDAHELLAAMPNDSADVVIVDPMMSQPKRAAPSMSLLRTFAWPAPASPQLLEQAARVARRRVVLKLGRGAPLPPHCPLPFVASPGGRAVAYYVCIVS